MKVHTSYYSNIRNIPADYFLVSTSGWIPDEIKNSVDSWDRSLAPSLDIYNQYKETNDSKIYIDRFKEERLSKIDWLEKLESFEMIATENGKNIENIVLLCYEKPDEFCHRHILAESIETEFKTNVEEIGFENYDRIGYKMEPKFNTDFLF